MDARQGKEWDAKREKLDTVGVPQPTSDEKLPFNLVSGVRTRPSACSQGSRPKGLPELCGIQVNGERPCCASPDATISPGNRLLQAQQLGAFHPKDCERLAGTAEVYMHLVGIGCSLPAWSECRPQAFIDIHLARVSSSCR